MLKRWLIRQVRDTAGDLVLAGLSLGIAFVLLGTALWYHVDLVAILNFNLSMVHLVSFIPHVGQGLEFLLRIWGIDHVLFFLELWAFVALILRVVGLSFRVCKKMAAGSVRRARNWIGTRNRR